MKEMFKGVISSLIATGIMYAINKVYELNFSFSLWIWLSISVGVLVIIYIVQKIVIYYKAKNFISKFTEVSFGNSYVYTWKYKRNRQGQYSAYGYEATDIRTKTPLNELQDKKKFILGHEVPESTIKMIIQLLLITNVDKKMGKQLKNVIEHLYWTEDSSKHALLH